MGAVSGGGVRTGTIFSALCRREIELNVFIYEDRREKDLLSDGLGGFGPSMLGRSRDFRCLHF